MELWLCRVIDVIGITLPLMFLCLFILSIFYILQYLKDYRENYDKSMTNKSFILLVTWFVIAVLSVIAIIAIPAGLFIGFPEVW